jgi:hypothetical protein
MRLTGDCHPYILAIIHDSTPQEQRGQREKSFATVLKEAEIHCIDLINKMAAKVTNVSAGRYCGRRYAK